MCSAVAAASIETEAVSLGHLIKNLNESVRGKTVNVPLAFSFKSDGRPVQGHILNRGGGCMLRIRTQLCPIPYTVEDTDLREHLLRLIVASSGEKNRYITEVGSYLSFLYEMEMPHQVTISDLIIGTTKAVICARPYHHYVESY